MMLNVGRRYRHRVTGRAFVIVEIGIVENPIEGGLNVRVAVDMCDEDNHRLVVGLTQVERWWPNLEEVEEVDHEALVSKYESPFPWCDVCGNCHDPEAPQCMKYMTLR